jgi:hypothetical protein
VKLTLLPTLKIRTASFPLIVTDCPVPSNTVFVTMLIVFVSTITPLQAKETLPAPAKAASRLAWSQFVTVPLAKAEIENNSKQQRIPGNSRIRQRVSLRL